MKSKKVYLRMRLLCFYSAKHIIKNVNIFTDNICFFARLVLILHEQSKVLLYEVKYAWSVAVRRYSYGGLAAVSSDGAFVQGETDEAALFDIF